MDTSNMIDWNGTTEGMRISPSEIDIATPDIQIIADLLKTTHGLIAFGILASLIGFYLYLRSTK